MKYITINNLINQAGDNAFFVGNANEQKIAEIEHTLGITLSDSYKWFLKEFGHGGIPGVEILGNGLGETPSCVRSTINWRKYGLPSGFVVIEDEGEDWIYCLDTTKWEIGECPVVDWEQNSGVGKKYFKSFSEFFEARLKGIN